jgi:outer membrane protein OmpA-like peptidoglycan-associated protein
MPTNRLLRVARVLGVPVAASALIACGTPPPSDELVAARQTYQEAANSNAAELVPDQLLSAKQALDQAESAHEEDALSTQERSLAYVAQRKAQLAMAMAGQAAAKRDMAASDREYEQLQDDLRKNATAALAKARSDLAVQGDTLAQERAARIAAEQKYLAAMKSLEEIARVKEEQRGMVITLSGEVLFVTGKADLLPIAREKLAKVAEVLQQQDPSKKIVVEGHTDSRGSEQMNLALSQRRADVVRSFLVSQGVEASRISAVGKGESTPVADNSTPDGRANNRRVEIVVK